MPTGDAPTKAAGRTGRRQRRAARRKAGTGSGRRPRRGSGKGSGKGHRKAVESTTTGEPFRKQLGTILRASHPRQAFLVGLGVFVLALLAHRGFLQSLVAGAAVLVVQMALGLGNDVADLAIDRKAGTEGKPLAAGDIPRGNVTYTILVLLIIAVPLALQNGWLAGVILLGTVLIGGVHNKWLHRGGFSWVGWVLTFGLLPAYLSYGSWPGQPHGAPPTWSFTVAAAALGLCLHFATALPDLVQDHAAGLKTLPLRVALETGAPRLLVITAVVSGLTLAGLLVAGLTVGLRQ